MPSPAGFPPSSDGGRPAGLPSDGGRSAGLPLTHVPARGDTPAADRTARDHDHDAAPAPAHGFPAHPPAFLFDFREPEAYLAAERVLRTMPVATPWVPIDSTRLPESTWGGFRCEADEEAARERIESAAVGYGLQPVVWPRVIQPDTRKALLAAWYAKGIGRVVSFSLPAFRQAFAGGHDLSHETPVLLAASACEMHPRAIVQAFGRPVIAAALDDATDRAIAAGVRRVPAIWTGDRVFHGDAGVDEAAAHLAARIAPD